MKHVVGVPQKFFLQKNLGNRSNHQSYKKIYSKTSARVLQEKTLAALLKRDSNTVSFCEYCKNFKNTYHEEQMQTAAFAEIVNQNLQQIALLENVVHHRFFTGIFLKSYSDQLWLLLLIFNRKRQIDTDMLFKIFLNK